MQFVPVPQQERFDGMNLRGTVRLVDSLDRVEVCVCNPRVLGGQGLRRCVVSCGTLLLWVSTYVFLSKERNLF